MICVFYHMTGAQEGSPKVVLWRNREQNLHSLKSDIDLSPSLCFGFSEL